MKIKLSILVSAAIAATGCAAGYGFNAPGPAGQRGAAGPQGQVGVQGIPGLPGQGSPSCTVSTASDGTVVITCPDGSNATIPPPSPEPSYICHVPPGNPSNARNLYIPQPAVAAHLAHGDYQGECQ